MKIQSTIIPILLLVIAVLLGALVYQNAMKKPDTLVEYKETPIAQKKLVVKPKGGSITGSLCFPSEGIPPLDIYLQNVATTKLTHMTTPANQMTYEFENVSPGDYIAFAYPQGQDHIGGGFTKAVPCGLSVDCEDHSPIVLEVTEDSTLSGADICDWYGADIPQKP